MQDPIPLTDVELDEPGEADLCRGELEIERALATLAACVDDETIASPAMGRIGQYQVERVLACHGQAAVVLARDELLERRVVLKIYHSAGKGQHRVRLINEGRALARMNDPNIARCYGVEEHEDALFLVIEYVEGSTLQEMISAQRLRAGFKRGSGSGRYLSLLLQIARAVERVHQAGLLHGDLKPSNVILTKSGRVKLIDFGLVSPLTEIELARESGTPAYMAPELARNSGNVIDERSDIFALGAILYEMLAGSPPFAAETKSESRRLSGTGEVVPLRQKNASVPEHIEALCMKCLQPDPMDRFATAGALCESIESAQLRLRYPLRFIFAAGLLALAVMAGCFWVISQNREAAISTTASELGSVSAPSEYLEVVDRFKQRRKQIRSAMREGDADRASLLAAEGVAAADTDELRHLFRREFELYAQEVTTWNSTSAAEQDQIVAAMLELERVSEAMRSLASAFQAEQFEDAMVSSEKCITTLEDALGESAMCVLAAKHLQISILQFGSKREALPLAIALREAYRRELGNDAERTLAAVRILAGVYRDHGRHDLAANVQAEGVAAAAPKSEMSRYLCSRSLWSRAQSLVTLHRWEEAEACAREASELHTDRRQDAPCDAVETLFWIKLALARQDFDEIVERASDAIAKWSRLPSSEMKDESVALISNYLAHAHARLNNKQAALDNLSLSLRLAENFGDRSVTYASILNTASRTLIYLGDIERAFELEKRTFEITRASNGDGTPHTLGVLRNLVLMAAQLGRQEEAAQYIQLLLAGAESLADEERVQVYLSVGNAYWVLRHDAEAYEFAQQASDLASEHETTDSVTGFWKNIRFQCDRLLGEMNGEA